MRVWGARPFEQTVRSTPCAEGAWRDARALLEGLCERALGLKAHVQGDLDERVRALDLGDSSALPYTDATFDLVVTRFSFHHLVEPLRTLLEMKRVCKPGGRVALETQLAASKKI